MDSKSHKSFNGVDTHEGHRPQRAVCPAFLLNHLTDIMPALKEHKNRSNDHIRGFEMSYISHNFLYVFRFLCFVPQIHQNSWKLSLNRANSSTHAGNSAKRFPPHILTFVSDEYLRLCCAAPALWFMFQQRGELQTEEEEKSSRIDKLTDYREQLAGGSSWRVLLKAVRWSSFLSVTRAASQPMKPRA